MQFIKRIRAWLSPDIRLAIDGIGQFFAVTLFFWLIQSAIGGIRNHNPNVDRYRW